MEQQRGYRDNVTLYSSNGEERTIRIPGRIATPYDPETGRRSNRTHIILTTSWMRKDEKEQRIRRDRMLQRLLSAGWKIAHQGEGELSASDSLSQNNEEAAKDTDKVIGATLNGDASHGGNHASCEVKDSPNHAKRGCRGGRSARSKKERIEFAKVKEKKQKREKYSLERQGGSGIFSPQRMRIDSNIIASTEKSAELLKCIVGQSHLRMRQGIEINAKEFLIALKIGDNPIPPLEMPHEVPRLRVIITPDCSGSTQSWSGIGRGWAHHISQLDDIDVVYIENMNGIFMWRNYSQVIPQKADVFLKEADMLIYLGDGDGYNLCNSYADSGARVIAFDCHLASIAKPRLQEIHRKSSGGELYWIDRVSAKNPMTWYGALKLVLSP